MTKRLREATKTLADEIGTFLGLCDDAFYEFTDEQLADLNEAIDNANNEIKFDAKEESTPLAAGLPQLCFANDEINGNIIVIKRGESGYFPFASTLPEGTDLEDHVDTLNKSLGVHKGQVEAMVMGSHFGWSTPGANPASYDIHGKFLKDTLDNTV